MLASGISGGHRLPAWTLFLLLLLNGFVLSPAEATVWLVLVDGSGDAPTIQAAVDSAAVGDSVLVGPGTYLESVLVAGKALTFLSQQGREQTLIQGNPSLKFTGSMSFAPRISGFTFTSPASMGVDVQCSPGPIFEASAFANCAGSGAFLAPNDYSAAFASCLFVNNGEEGLAIGAFFVGSATCTGCEFRDNASSGVGGGASHLTNCLISGNGGSGVTATSGKDFRERVTTVRDCVITGNGGYGLQGESSVFAGTRFDAFNTTISNNSLGGMFGNCYGVRFQMEDCEISGNSGFVGETKSSFLLRRCVVRGNASGLFALRTCHVVPSAGQITLEETTYHANGGGLFAQPTLQGQQGRITVTRSIISGTLQGGLPVCSNSSLVLSVNCTDLFGNAAGDSVCDSAGSDNFSLDPLFCDAAGGDLTLSADSPCAPEHSPPGCELIGALPVGCGVVGSPEPGAAPLALDAGLRVLPNPIRSHGAVEWLAEAPAELRLYDSLGRLVAYRDLSGTPLESRSIRWESIVRGIKLAPGVYYLESANRVTSERRGTRVVVLH